MTLELILGLLGVVGVGLFAFLRVRKSPVGARREHEIEVAGERKVKAIRDQAAEARKRVEQDLADSRGKDPSDAIRDLIARGKVSK